MGKSRIEQYRTETEREIKTVWGKGVRSGSGKRRACHWTKMELLLTFCHEASGHVTGSGCDVPVPPYQVAPHSPVTLRHHAAPQYDAAALLAYIVQKGQSLPTTRTR